MTGQVPEAQPKAGRFRPGSYAILLCAATLLVVSTTARAATPGQQQVTRDFQKTLSLPSGQSFRIENKFGEVRIHGESSREVKISATIRTQADSREQAQSFADKVQIEVQQTAQGIEVRTQYPEDTRNWFGRKNASYSVDYDIAVPSDAPLLVKNSFGNVNVSGVRSKSEFDNSHGSLNVRDTGSARLTNSFGSIELNGASGDVSVTDNNGSVQVLQVKGSLEVRNRFGSMEARNIHGDLMVHDNNGNIDVSNVGGAADITDSFGNVAFSQVKGRVNCTTSNGRVNGSSLFGNAVTIRDSFGELELSNITGTLNAETSNGKITLRSAHGTVELKSSFGAIEASDIAKGIRAITGNGSITLTDIGGDTFAKTSFGSVSADRINGNLIVENTNGSITARNVKGDAQATTSFAGVTLDSVGGKITVNDQNGGISVTAARPASGCRDIALKTSFSSIRVRIPDSLGYHVNAHTSFGRISSDLPIATTGSMSPESLDGTIGSGGCQLQLTNANGSIEITRAQ